MSRTLPTLAAMALVLGLGACQDGGSPTGSNSNLTLADGFSTMPLGFADVNSTFGSVSDSGTTPWHPRGHGFHGGGGMMCGGLNGFFGAGLDFGLRNGPWRGQFGSHCAYDATAERVLCDTLVRNGLSIVQSTGYYDTAGTVQSGFDPATTNTVNVQISVTGTALRHDGDTSVVDHHSDRTVTGLAPGSTTRTIDGTSAGSETTTGTDSTGHFTAVRALGDTLVGVMVPNAWGRGVFPTAGTISRGMSVTVTYDGQPPVTHDRHELITFDGSGIATIVITQDGTTQNCTVQLPHGRPSCS